MNNTLILFYSPKPSSQLLSLDLVYSYKEINGKRQTANVRFKLRIS